MDIQATEDWGTVSKVEIESEQQAQQEMDKASKLKYPYAYDELGRLKSAQQLTKEDKLNHEYFIEGITDSGKYGKEKVLLAVCKEKRNYFRRYPSDSAKYTGERVHTTIRDYNESILHKLVKQLFIEGKITAVMLPPVNIELALGGIRIANKQYFPITHVELEQTYHTPLGDVRYDIVVKNAKGEQLGVEVLVSHAVDKDKKDKIEASSMEVVELDFSELALNTHLIGSELESQIIQLITNSTIKTHWVNNLVGSRVSKWLAGLHITDLVRNRRNHDEDGKWGTYIFDKLPIGDSGASRQTTVIKCPHIKTYQRTAIPAPSIYLTQSQCENCPNHIYADWNDQSGSGISICSHSDVPSSYILALLAKLNNPNVFWDIS